MALTVCKKCCLEWQADSGGEACPRCALGSAEAERDRLREALESLVKCHANGGFVEPDEDVLTQARAAIKPAGGEPHV